MDCGLCFESFNETINRPYNFYKCGHAYCIKCIDQLKEKKCPMCNQPIDGKYPCYAILQLIKEPKVKKSIETQTCQSGLVGSSFDSCQKRIFKLLKKDSSNIPDIIEKIEKEFEFSQIVDINHKSIFICALVLAVSRSCLNSNVGLDEDKLKSLCSLLKIYIERDEELELAAFLAIRLLQRKLNNSPECFENILKTFIENFSSQNSLSYFLIKKQLDDLAYIKHNAAEQNLLDKDHQVEPIISVSTQEQQTEISSQPDDLLQNDSPNQQQEFPTVILSANVAKKKRNKKINQSNQSEQQDIVETDSYSITFQFASKLITQPSLLDDLEINEKEKKCYEKIIQSSDDVIRMTMIRTVFNNKGFALLNLKRYEEAIKSFDRALQMNPTDSKAYIFKGVVLNKLMRFKEAVQAFNKAIQIKPNDPVAYVNKGFALRNLQRYEEAIKCCDKAIQLDPNYSDAYFNKGFSCRYLKRLREAIQCFDNAIRVNPNDIDAYVNKGIAFSLLNLCKEAIENYDKALQINPHYSEAYNNKGSALGCLNKHQEAIVCFDNAIRLNPNHAKAYNNKGLNLEYLERYGEAIECYDNAIRINPNFYEAYFNKGISLDYLDKFEESLHCYDNVIRINPANIDAFMIKALHNKGIASLNLGWHEEAIKIFDKVIQLDPNNSIASHYKKNASDFLNRK